MSSNLINSSKAKVPGSNPGGSTGGWKAIVPTDDHQYE